MFSGGLVDGFKIKKNQIPCDEEIEAKSCSIDDWRISVDDVGVFFVELE